jgi:hypothetical protein
MIYHESVFDAEATLRAVKRCVVKDSLVKATVSDDFHRLARVYKLSSRGWNYMAISRNEMMNAWTKCSVVIDILLEKMSGIILSVSLFLHYRLP